MAANGSGIGFWGAISFFATGVLVGAAALPNVAGVADLLDGLFQRTSVAGTARPCAEATLACLQAKHRELGRADARIEDSIQQLRPAAEQVTDLVRRQRERLAHNELLLNEGRAALLRADDPSRPIRFVGTDYPNRDALVRQLQLLWDEREAMAAVVRNATGQIAAMQRRHDELLVSRSEVRTAISMLPAQLELARATSTAAEISSSLAEIERVMGRTEHTARRAGNWMRTTEELLRTRTHAAEMADGPSPDADRATLGGSLLEFLRVGG
jgi:prefoldin subunit 5